MFSHPDEASADQRAREARSLAETHPASEIAIVQSQNPSGYSKGAELGLSILGAIFAEHVHLIGKEREDAKRALHQASKMARSHVVHERGAAGDLESGLEGALKSSSIVFLLEPDEATLERAASSLSDEALVFVDPGEGTLKACLDKAPSLKSRVIGLRLFGPPHLTTGAELLRASELDEARFALGAAVLSARFGLLAVEVSDRPLGLARRLEAKLLNEAAKLAEAYPAHHINAALGGETGRPKGALALLDAIGWENHRRRINLLSEESGDARLRAPSFMSGGDGERSFFKKGDAGELLALDLPSGRYIAAPSGDEEELEVYHAMSALIEVGEYEEALETLMNASGALPKLTRELLAAHLVDAFGAVGDGVASIAELDRLVGAALGWIPPGALVDLIGLERSKELITEAGLGVPSILSDRRDGERLHHDPRLSPGSYLGAYLMAR